MKGWIDLYSQTCRVQRIKTRLDVIGGRGLDLGDRHNIHDDDPSVGLFLVTQIPDGED